MHLYQRGGVRLAFLDTLGIYPGKFLDNLIQEFCNAQASVDFQREPNRCAIKNIAQMSYGVDYFRQLPSLR